MLNKITLQGRLCTDVELRRTNGGDAVASFRIACDRDYKTSDGRTQTDFIDIVCWKKTGEFVADHFHKGNPILVSGRLEMRTWTDKEGNKRTTAEVNAQNVYFTESKGATEHKTPTGAPAANNFDVIEQEDRDLPF